MSNPQNAPPPQMTWEESVMKQRETLKLEFINFQDNIFGILDPFFKTTIQIAQQIELISTENMRLMALCKKNNVDTAIPIPEAVKVAEIPPKDEKQSKQSI